MYVRGTVDEELVDAIIRMHDVMGGLNIQYKDIYPWKPEEGWVFSEYIFELTSLITSIEGESSINAFSAVLSNMYALCEYLGVRTDDVIRWKMDYNSKREYRHGKSY
jgi:hypothetical protein